MSTRSGKRIHKSDDLTSEINSSDENPTQRSTRSRRLKENVDLEKTNFPKSKRRKNYVALPSDEEDIDIVLNKELPLRKRDTLKEIKDNQNKNNTVNFKPDVSNEIDFKPAVRDEADSKSAVRATRRTRRFVEDTRDESTDSNNDNYVRAGTRKRSHTACENEEQVSKRQRTLEGRQEAIDRLSRPRSFSAQPNQTESTPKRQTPGPTKPQPGSRTKLPNFAALHQKQFSKMESLDECQERKKRRAKRLLVPNGSLTILERSSPKPTLVEPKSTTKVNQTPSQAPQSTTKVNQTPSQAPKSTTKVNQTPLQAPKSTTKVNQTPLQAPKSTTKVKPSESPKPSVVKQTASEPRKSTIKTNTATTKPPKESANPISASTANKTTTDKQSEILKTAATTSKKPFYTRFGFKLNLDVNPFSITSQSSKTTNTEAKPNGAMKRERTMPQLNGYKSRKEVAKSILAREKSTINLKVKLDEGRQEARTIIKGVRSNRRFELQMKMRRMN